MMQSKKGRKGGVTQNKFFIVLFVLLLLVASLASGSFAAPKKVSTAKPGDCAACHAGEKVLPPDHPDTKQMNRAGCLPCHQKSGKGSLQAKMPGSHTHNLAGVGCEKCHGKVKKQKAVEMAKCITCHNPAKLVEKTAKV